MRRISFAVALLVLAVACSAQTKVPHAKTPPKPEPTEPELAEYIRGQLIALSPSDGINDNADVSYNADTKVLTVTGPSGRCETSIPALNANALVWDLFDPSDTDRTREKLLRLTFVSVSGKTARTCYDKDGHVDSLMPTNRARFLFSESHADETPNFQQKMAKAFQKLIALTGGAPQKDLF